MNLLLDKANEIERWLYDQYGLKARFDGESGGLLMHFQRAGFVGRAVVLKLFARKRMRRWWTEGVEILAQRFEHDAETGELVAVHGQWARDEGEHKEAIEKAIDWMLWRNGQFDIESIGSHERSNYLV